jgi:hypothetical protein
MHRASGDRDVLFDQAATVSDAPAKQRPRLFAGELGCESATEMDLASTSLPWNHREPLCGPPFPQVTPDRQGQSYRFSFGEVMCSLLVLCAELP